MPRGRSRSVVAASYLAVVGVLVAASSSLASPPPWAHGHGGSPAPSPTASPSPTLAPSPSTPPPASYVFDEEFGGVSLSPVWGTTSHWTGLSEAVSDRSTLSVASGYLTITARRVGGAWHAGELDTWGRWERTYGRYEARVRFTSGRGLWPAFWLANDWTGDRSEIDVDETLANPYAGACADDSGAYYATVHLSDGSTPQGSRRRCAGTDLAEAWHVYAADWRADHVTFYLDGVAWYTYSGVVPTATMPIVLNLAVGGWAGPSDSTTPDPSRVDVDWVRVSP